MSKESSAEQFGTYQDRVYLPIHTNKIHSLMQHFYESYMKAISQSKIPTGECQRRVIQLLDFAKEQMQTPYRFEIFHQSIRSPFDYYRFGLDFIRPLINFAKSHILRLEQVERMVAQIANEENVILLANHQTEPDPQIINLLLEPYYPDFAAHMIFIAGHRVIEDPIAIPISMGCNLLCIYSKKHIDNPPEMRPQKVLHNQRTMQKMSELLSKGGKCIYVAPSGGRDRINAQGIIDVAPFDPQSIEMFRLIAQRSSKPTHFYPLSLATYGLLPPPVQVEKELGEKREAYYVPVHLAFGQEIDMETFPGSEQLDRKSKRKRRAEYIWNLVRQDYHVLKAQAMPNA